MELEELAKLLPIANDSVEVQPMDVLEDYFFRYGTRSTTYREQSIDFAIKHKLPITNTCNNTYLLAKRYIAFVCPSCGANMEVRGGSGSNSTQTIDYRCPKCKVYAWLTLQTNHDGLSITFPEEG